MAIEFHPLANIFPLVEGAAFDELAASVRENGLRERIVLLEGRILDGRNRYKALLAAGLLGPHDGPRQDLFEPYDAGRCGDPLRYVLDHNLHRRHLTDDQRRMVAARIANMGKGRPEKNGPNGPINRDKAAELLSVDPRGVKRARAVLTHGAEELQAAVDERRLTVRLAADMATLPVERQKEILAFADRRVIAEAVRGERRGIGTRSDTAEARGLDFYRTPPEAVRALLALERFGATIWEPACGDGAISTLLEAAGHDVVLSDIADRGCADRHGECQAVTDFLATDAAWLARRTPAGADIVTNPPFGIANAFAAHALRAHRPAKMALLLNLNFLCGFDDADRNYAMDECPPARVHVFTRRLPMMHRDGWDGPRAGSQMNTAWFVWEAGHGPTVLNRVDWKDHSGAMSEAGNLVRNDQTVGARPQQQQTEVKFG